MQSVVWYLIVLVRTSNLNKLRECNISSMRRA